MEITGPRPTLTQNPLMADPTSAKQEQQQVKTELAAGQAVTALKENTATRASSEKSHPSDTRANNHNIKEEEVKLVREYRYDNEYRDMVYKLKSDPSGEVIFEIPSETSRRIRGYLDKLINLQEQGVFGTASNKYTDAQIPQDLMKP
ncbi:hypothetical protein [Polycladidibacter stylochi]|uniref:hypothetical protein n=1 Tax=Polycladidibacter stylochi TaxID=1807766 RepID=UPI000ABE5486|nr:hypothetical protein [Pseudovibrio stylochi]